VGFVLPEAARDDVLLEVGIDNWNMFQHCSPAPSALASADHLIQNR
jgi:hypothetical protein